MSKAQEFEKVLEQSDTSVVSFESHIKSPVEKFQHFLHSSQAAVPLIVLILSIAIFGVLVGGKFFNPFSLTLILQQVAIVGIVGAAQTLVILTAGIVFIQFFSKSLSVLLAGELLAGLVLGLDGSCIPNSPSPYLFLSS